VSFQHCTLQTFNRNEERGKWKGMKEKGMKWKIRGKKETEKG